MACLAAVLMLSLLGVAGCSRADSDEGHADHVEGHDHDHDHDHDGPEHAETDSDSDTGGDASDEQPPVTEPASTEPDAAGGGSADEAWTVPAGWTRVPGERPMRYATFEATTEAGPVEIAITRFPGTVGGELANINRWRGQVGESPISDAELEDAVERFETPGFRGYATRVDGPRGVLLAVGVYEDASDQTWFAKTTTNAEAADELEAQILAFARSIAGLEPGGDG